MSNEKVLDIWKIASVVIGALSICIVIITEGGKGVALLTSQKDQINQVQTDVKDIKNTQAIDHDKVVQLETEIKQFQDAKKNKN